MTNTTSYAKDSVESGQTVALVAMSLIVLLGFASLAVDVGFLWNKRRQMQSTADVAALGGMRGLAQRSVVAPGLRDAAPNYFTNGIRVTGGDPQGERRLLRRSE